MHGLAIVNLALVGLVARVLALSIPLPGPPTSVRRKTLGFGPDLPHAYFGSVDIDTSATVDATKDPYAVARDFLSRYDDLQASRTYVIRPDSYTDYATGVTHIYARQIIGGIEVANAHVNLNIKNGRVLSFGDSFFPGELDRLSRVPVHFDAHHCTRLSSALDVHRSLRPLSSRDRTGVTHGFDTLERLYLSNCANVPIASPGEVDMDPRRPLLVFLASALPENHPEFSSFGDKLGEHVSGIIMTPETHVLGEHVSLGMSLSNVPGAVSDVKARIVWVQVPTEHSVKLELAHRFEVEMDYNWYETTVTTSIPHRTISVVDWVSDSPMPVSVAGKAGRLPNFGAFVPPGSTFELAASAPVQALDKTYSKKLGVPELPDLNKASYLVFPWGTNDPVEAAKRKAAKYGESLGAGYSLSYGRETIKELGDTLASPAGWHTLPVSHDPSVSKENGPIVGGSYWRTTRTTWGNNVFAQENWEGEEDWMYNGRPLAHADGVFAYPYSPEPTLTQFESLEQARAHVNASVTQLFYTTNMVHDLFYRYGFTEVAGNFQQYNFGRGGDEGDAVIADAQEGHGFNNAAFRSPPDGENGRCHINLWNTNSPYPDGDMDASIVIHELSHGLSSRLTGGPKNAGCLGWGESGGMGEGWGDMIAVTVRSTSNYSDYTVGAWAANHAEGVRRYPYSADFSVNPTTYESLNKPGFSGPHQLGETWAEMLWVIQQRLIVKHGFSDTLLPPVPKADGSLPPNDFYRPQTFSPLTGLPNPLVPKHGNTLMLQLVINGMKMQPCTPNFFDARAAIIEADKVLTGGENECDIWEGFAERGLGVDTDVIGRTPWGGGVRKNGFRVPAQCRFGPEPESTSELTGHPDDHEPSSLWYLLMSCAGKWIPKILSWGY